VFKESDRSATRSPTTFDQSHAGNAGPDTDQTGGAHTDRSHGKPAAHEQSRHDRKKQDETRKKLVPSMKWRVLETETRTEDADKDAEMKPAAEKQPRKASGGARSRE